MSNTTAVTTTIATTIFFLSSFYKMARGTMTILMTITFAIVPRFVIENRWVMISQQ
ncbi:MAG: hypothetical protein JO297_07870 [Nitrososphaeraceae archaeon]|nr:hypothetical protein [Nitrososphaeraceae archaeon]